MEKTRNTVNRTWGILVILVLVAAFLIPGCNEKSFIGAGESESSWVTPPPYEKPNVKPEGETSYTPAPMPTILPEAGYDWELSSKNFSSDETIGLAVGGAKDINNFRENIENGYLPLPTDITYEGLFYDYYFDTGDSGQCDSLFCPSYSYAVSRDPFSGEDEYYLSVGLNSGLRESDFERKKLNLVVVLDVSGSMDSPFDQYYYDQFGNRRIYDDHEEYWDKTKIEVATDSIVALMNHLEDDDRFGVVLFNGDAWLAKPFNLVGDTDMDAIETHILDLRADGSTNLAAGMKLATDEFRQLYDRVHYDRYEYENRIIFLTDAMPNTGETSSYDLFGMAEANADEQIYTTFIGIGVDFNTELIESIINMRGANYYSVHSSREFENRMDDEFEYMVTPLVFDLELKLYSRGWEIEQVYGSPEADEATGEIMRINTLFPSAKSDGETRGGLVLLKLRRTSSHYDEISLEVTYEDRYGNRDRVESEINLYKEKPEYFDNYGIRKGILLSRYADLLTNWLLDERTYTGKIDDWIEPWEPRVNYEDGICVPPHPASLSQWERQSMPLRVSEQYEDLFREFMEYFEHEMDILKDSDLKQEMGVLENLC